MKTYPLAAEKVVSYKKADTALVAATVLLWGLGMVTLYIASEASGIRIFKESLYFVLRQLVFSAAGCVLLLIFALTNLDFFRKILPLIVVGGLIVCLLTFAPLIGIEKNGARRWIGWGNASIQPSEFVKIIIPLFLANLFSKKHENINDLYGSIGPAVFFLFAFVGIIFLQDDFSTAVFILFLGLFMFFIAGVNLRWFIGMACAAIPLSVIFIFKEQYRIVRIISFFNREFDVHGAGFQVSKARAAVAAGGFWGHEGASPGRYFTEIPEVQADFIFTGWAEEMGYIGVVFYFLLLSFFAWRGFYAALACRDRFRSLLAFGATVAVLGQSLLNCGVVIGVFPPTGIPLPFFSAGGSSLLATLGLCGLIINVSRWNSELGMANE